MLKKPAVAVVTAILVPVLLQIVLEALYRWLPLPALQAHDFIVMLINVIAVGGFLLFRAFRPVVAAAIMVAYVPLMIAIQFGAISAFVGIVYGDAI